MYSAAEYFSKPQVTLAERKKEELAA